MSDQTTAAQFFAAQIAFASARERVEDLLDAALGEDGWSDWTADYYDESIEVYGASVPAGEETNALRDAGFAMVWFHGHERREVAGERCQCPVQYLRVTVGT